MIFRFSPLLLFLGIVVTGCAIEPLPSVQEEKIPPLVDDLDDPASLQQAIANSLAYLSKLPADKTFPIHTRTVSVQDLSRSLQFFQQLLLEAPSPVTLHYLIKKNFTLYEATGHKGKDSDYHMLVTGYYQPVLEGSLVRRAPFLHPVYSIPSDLVVQRKGEGRIVGRLGEKGLLPYWTRREIEEGHKAKGHELVYLRDPLDVFFLHVQGSGVVSLENGEQRQLRFAQKNGHPYRSIGKYLVDKGRLELAEVTMDRIRQYLKEHPEELHETIYHNDSFVFFQWGDDLQAVGSLNQPLTPGRSVAADQTIFPGGALAYLESRQPVIRQGQLSTWKPLHRFVCIQDKGAAIQGSGRVDLFWGRGNDAGAAAGLMKESGRMFLLLLNDNHPALSSADWNATLH